MSNLYHIDPDATTTHGTLAVVRLDKGKGYTHVGVLVPVEPCEHGNYARHIVAGGIVPGDNHNQWHDEYGRVICEASNDD